MKILTKEEEREHYNATLQGGAIGGFTGLAAGTAAVYVASMRFPAFRTLTLPFRTFLIASTSTFASMVAADSASRAFEDKRMPERKYVDKQAMLQDQLESQKSGQQKTVDWLSRNRYSIVFGSWVASMGAALAIVGRDRYLTTQQKLVQARVYAQGFTLAAVIVSLAFEGGDRMAGSGRWETVKYLDPNDPTHKNIIEKKIHHERYRGEDQWMDMVEAEERRMKERSRANGKQDQSGEPDGDKAEGKSDKKAQAQQKRDQSEAKAKASESGQQKEEQPASNLSTTADKKDADGIKQDASSKKSSKSDAKSGKQEEAQRKRDESEAKAKSGESGQQKDEQPASNLASHVDKKDAESKKE